HVGDERRDLHPGRQSDRPPEQLLRSVTQEHQARDDAQEREGLGRVRFQDRGHVGNLRLRNAADAQGVTTSNDLLAAGTPFALISTLYWPAGQPSGFAMWNSFTAGPVGAIDSESSFTSCPSAP